MIVREAHDIVERTLEPLPLARFLDDILDKSFVKVPGGSAPRRASLLGDNPKQAILDAYSWLAPRIGSHADNASGPPPAIEPVGSASAFRAKIDGIYRQVHAVKGEAAALGLKTVEQRAHAFEESLSDLKGRATLSGSDFLPLVFAITSRICRSSARVG